MAPLVWTGMDVDLSGIESTSPVWIWIGTVIIISIAVLTSIMCGCCGKEESRKPKGKDELKMEKDEAVSAASIDASPVDASPVGPSPKRLTVGKFGVASGNQDYKTLADQSAFDETKKQGPASAMKGYIDCTTEQSTGASSGQSGSVQTSSATLKHGSVSMASDIGISKTAVSPVKGATSKTMMLVNGATSKTMMPVNGATSKTMMPEKGATSKTMMPEKGATSKTLQQVAATTMKPSGSKK